MKNKSIQNTVCRMCRRQLPSFFVNCTKW